MSTNTPGGTGPNSGGMTTSQIATDAGMGLSAFGTLLSTQGVLQQGQDVMQAAQYKAAQSRQNATQALASGSQQVNQIYTQLKMTQSRALAVAAASGADAMSPTVVNLTALNAGYGAYNENMATYNANMKANAFTNQANADIFAGQQAQQAAHLNAGATILSGAGSIARLAMPFMALGTGGVT